MELLLQNLGSHICPKVATNNALSAKDKILIFLRFVAANSFYYELDDLQGNNLNVAIKFK